MTPIPLGYQAEMPISTLRGIPIGISFQVTNLLLVAGF